jgi:hypothetical protein
VLEVGASVHGKALWFAAARLLSGANDLRPLLLSHEENADHDMEARDGQQANKRQTVELHPSGETPKLRTPRCGIAPVRLEDV